MDCRVFAVDFDADNWTCSNCKTVQTLVWDEELEQEVGFPAALVVNDDGSEFAICDDCVEGREPHELMDGLIH